MNLQKVLYKIFCLGMLLLWLLAGCQQPTTPTIILFTLTTTPSIIPSMTSGPSLTPFRTPIPSSTPTQELPTPTPGTGYQLTYVSECQKDSQCMYAMDIGCLENVKPCLGEPHLLFEVSKTDQGPKPPVEYSAWSPDGKHVAICATGVKDQGDVFVGDWNGKNWVNLTNSPIFECEPAWTPDGLYISYSGSSGEPDYHVWAFMITPDGKHVERIMASENLSGIHRLSWSPDGQRVVFMHSDENGYNQLFTAKPDGSGLKQLTDQPEDYFDPHFSPDGKWIVATRELGKFEDTQQYEIIVIKSDGSGEIKVIYQSPDYLFQPVWSPIGNWIAFTEGDTGLNIIKSDGSGLMRVSANNASIFAPAWRKISSP